MKISSLRRRKVKFHEELFRYFIKLNWNLLDTRKYTNSNKNYFKTYMHSFLVKTLLHYIFFFSINTHY